MLSQEQRKVCKLEVSLGGSNRSSYKKKRSKLMACIGINYQKKGAAMGWQTRQLMNLACRQSSRPLFVHTPVAASTFVPLLPFAQCQGRGRTSILLSPPRLTGATASGRVYRPILVQLNVCAPDSWPCLPGATGSSVHRQLMANPESDSGQLFPLKAAWMPLAANNGGRQETCQTHTVLL